MASGIEPQAARALARRAVAAECEGHWQQGLSDVLSQARQVESGQVEGQASPVIESIDRRHLVADAGHGFITPALEQGLVRAATIAHGEGYCLLRTGGAAVPSPGVLGQHLEPAVDQGLIALGFDVIPHAPDTNPGPPLCLALPRPGNMPLVIDLSAADLAQGHLWLAATQQQPLPEAWVLDDQGQAAADAGQAATVGDPVAARLALIASLIAAAIGEAVGADWSDLSDTRDGPCFILIDPVRLGASQTDFDEELDAILALAAMDREQALPGSQRQRAREHSDAVGIRVPRGLYQRLTEQAARAD